LLIFGRLILKKIHVLPGISTGVSHYLVEMRISKMRNHVQLRNKDILDLGCGTGEYSLALSRFAKRVIGIDFLISNIEKAVESQKLTKGRNVQFKRMNAENLFFPNSSFDVILLNEVYEHLNQPEKVLHEISRVLRKSGVLILFIPNRFYPFEGHGIHLENSYFFHTIPFIPWLPNFILNRILNARNFTPKAIVKELQMSGLDYFELDWLLPTFDSLFKNHESRILLGLHKIMNCIEKTILRRLGMSIILFARKRT
jgi:ubiquinone/menaquinone biosynthesis C-methylase UbiE